MLLECMKEWLNDKMYGKSIKAVVLLESPKTHLKYVHT